MKNTKKCQFLDDLESRVPVLLSPQNHIDSLDILVPAGKNNILLFFYVLKYFQIARLTFIINSPSVCNAMVEI